MSLGDQSTSSFAAPSAPTDDAHHLAAKLRASRVVLLFGSSALGQSTLLTDRLIPLLRRRAADAVVGRPVSDAGGNANAKSDAKAVPSQTAPGTLAFPDRRQRAVDPLGRPPAEIAVYFGDWQGSAMSRLKVMVQDATGVKPADRLPPDTRLDVLLETLQKTLRVRFLFVIDRFDEILKPAEQSQRSALRAVADELFEASDRLLLRANFLFSIQEASESLLPQVRSPIAGFDDVSIHLPLTASSATAASVPQRPPSRTVTGSPSVESVGASAVQPPHQKPAFKSEPVSRVMPLFPGPAKPKGPRPAAVPFPVDRSADPEPTRAVPIVLPAPQPPPVISAKFGVSAPARVPAPAPVISVPVSVRPPPPAPPPPPTPPPPPPPALTEVIEPVDIMVPMEALPVQAAGARDVDLLLPDRLPSLEDWLNVAADRRDAPPGQAADEVAAPVPALRPLPPTRSPPSATLVLGATGCILIGLAVWLWRSTPESIPVGAAGREATAAAPPSAAVPAPTPPGSLPPASPPAAPTAGNDDSPEGAMARELTRSLAGTGFRIDVGASPLTRPAAATISPAGALRFAIARYDELQALRAAPRAGNGAPDASLQVVTPLYTEEIHLFVRADSPLRFAHEIEGRHVNVGPADGARARTIGSLYQRMFGRALATPQSDGLPLATAFSRLIESSPTGASDVEVVALVGGQPLTALPGLPADAVGKVRLLKFDDANAATQQAMRSFLPGTLRAADAPFTSGTNAESTPTLAVMSFLVASGPSAKDLAAGDVQIGQLAQAFCERLPQLQREGHAKWREVRPGLALETGWPTSEVARRAFAQCHSAESRSPPS